MLAGTDDGLFARGPGASAWTRVPVHLDGAEARPRVRELLAPARDRIIAVTRSTILVSADRGRAWTRTVLGRTDEILTVAVSPVDPGLVIAATRTAIHRSTNGGVTWAQVSRDLDGVAAHALVFMPGDDRAVLATTSGGLFRSRDQGGSWQRVNGGAPHSDLTGIAVHLDGHTLYVSDFTRGGVLRSTDGGRTMESHAGAGPGFGAGVGHRPGSRRSGPGPRGFRGRGAASAPWRRSPFGGPPSRRPPGFCQ